MSRIGRRTFLHTALGAAPAILGAATRPPNVLFILPDEWRAQSTGYNGDKNVRTPVLDRLAAESVNFETTVSGTPVCCPYRASLMTGQYPLTNGVFINDVELKPNGPTLGQAFAARRISTGYIGKWHLYGSPDGKYGRRLAYIPPEKRFGFEYWKACECTHEYNSRSTTRTTTRPRNIGPGTTPFAQTDDACRFIDGPGGQARSVPAGALARAAAFSAGDRAGKIPRAIRKGRNPTARQCPAREAREGHRRSARLLRAHAGAGRLLRRGCWARSTAPALRKTPSWYSLRITAT